MEGDDPVLDTTNTENNLEMKKEAEKRKLHSMAKVHNLLEMWQYSQNLRATQKESRPHNRQMTDIGYISDTEEIVNASSSLFQHDCSAAFELSERSRLPPALSAKDLPAGQTQILNVHRIRTIKHHPADSDDECESESISDSKNRLNWNSDLGHLNNSKDDCAVEVESDIVQNNGIEDP